MEIDARVEAWASLQLLPRVSARALVALLKSFGGPAQVLAASPAMLAKVVPAETAAAIARGPDPAMLEQTLAWLREPGHALIAWDDPAYPRALLSIADPPPVLYFRGRSELLNRPALAIVGSRNATMQGRETAEAFAKALSDAGLTIVSGLALGIDAAAHRGGSDRRRAPAWPSSGPVSTAFIPAANRDLAQRLATEGGVLSEFALGHAADCRQIFRDATA